MNTYAGKNIWIIGASSGIGEALAKELALRGAKVILSARRKDVLEKVRGALSGEGHVVCPIDVRDIRALKDIIAELGAKSIKIDSVIFLPAMYKIHNIAGHDIDYIHQMIAVNLTGAFNLVHFIKPVFKEQGYGQIALCASIAAYRGLPMGQPYCATKAALFSYAESLKLDLAHDNIDVKVISPGFVKTPLTDKNEFPMPFMIEPEEAAKRIANGLLKKGFEVHFPKRMTVLMKMLRIVPHFLYFSIMRFIAGRIN